MYNIYCLADYNYAEKEEALRISLNIKASIKRSFDDSTHDFLEQRLNELNEKLSRLEELPVKEVEEKHDVENAIILVLENDIKKFKLFILKKFNFYMEFSLHADDIIHMKFTPFKELNEYFELDAYEIKALQHLGFRMSEDVLFIDFDMKNDSIKSIKVLLSRIFFEVFHWSRRKIFELVIY